MPPVSVTSNALVPALNAVAIAVVVITRASITSVDSGASVNVRVVPLTL